MSMTGSRLAALVLAICMSGCRGGSGGGPTAPSASGGSAPASGPWTGTFTRPDGLAPLSVRWEVTVETSPDDLLRGPMTLTNGANSVTVRARGNLGGNDRQGYSIHMQLEATRGEIAAFPNCAVIGVTRSEGGGDPFPRPYTSITVSSLELNYNDCLGFIEQRFAREIGRLSLTKQ